MIMCLPHETRLTDQDMENNMPLQTSPIDGSPMRKVVKHGVEIDICPTSGGIWLDKGELEKIMQYIRQDGGEANTNTPLYRSAKPGNKNRLRLADIFDL